jgi:hypothetical protein
MGVNESWNMTQLRRKSTAAEVSKSSSMEETHHLTEVECRQGADQVQVFKFQALSQVVTMPVGGTAEFG